MTKKIIYSENYINTGLLILRIGIGVAFILHGYPKLFLGKAVGLSKGLAAAGIPGGVTAAYLAGAAELLGGLALILGLFFRPASLVMAFTMLVAVVFHLNLGDNFIKYSHALESFFLFISLVLIGPGKFSLDRKLFGSTQEQEGSAFWDMKTKAT